MQRVLIGPAIALLICALIAGCAAGERAAPGQPGAAAPPVSEVPATDLERRLAAELLQQARDDFEEGNFLDARDSAERVVNVYPGTSASSAALLLAARAAFELGDLEASERMARRYMDLFDADAAQAAQGRALLERIETEEPPEPAPAPEIVPRTVVVGVILPQSGAPELERYAELVLDGMELAINSSENERSVRVDLHVLDSQGQTDRAPLLVAELEEENVVAVIGPLLTPALRTAADSRRTTTLAIVSPTASTAPPGRNNVYTLNAGDARGAEALADFVLQRGVSRAAVLYPLAEEFQRQADAFAARVRALGAQIVAQVAYDPGSTNFAEEIRRVRETEPEAIYVPAPAREVRQLAPQLVYYDVRASDVWILGGEAWAAEESLRLIDPGMLEGVIATTPLYEGDSDHRRAEFVDLYEGTHRRTLDNPYPALGYDAMRMVLAAIEEAAESGAVGVREVSRELAGIRDLPGATGSLSVVDGRVAREPHLVRIREGELVSATAEPLEFRTPPSEERSEEGEAADGVSPR